MDQRKTILLLDDEPLILMDLEFAAEERELAPLRARSLDQAMSFLQDASRTVDVAVLDVSLTDESDCCPIAEELERRGIPYVLHSGDLERQNDNIRHLKAPLITKPALSEKVIAAAISQLMGDDPSNFPIAA
jgi:DNA-binding response OmpR family regulator